MKPNDGTATIHDVAARAGVAAATVSRALNRSGYVSAETRARVERAISELGYSPNRLAQALRLKQSGTVALVVTDITNPFWTTVARGVEDTVNAAGFSLILCNTDESPEKQEQYLSVLLRKQIDGLLLVPACCDVAATLGEIRSQGVEVVLLDQRVPGTNADIVRGDSEGGAYRLVRHLIERGHQRIAVLSGSQQIPTAADRVAGYRRALAEAGLPVDERLVFYGTYTQAGGYAGAQKALAVEPQPTAFFAANNFIAIGALRALKAAGLRVPEDLALVAFDDLTSELVIEPFLTSVDHPAYEMGRRATELLLARMAGTVSGPYQEVVLPTELVVRRSSGPVVHPG